MVLVLHINKSKLLLLILSNKTDKLATLLNLVQRLNKLVGEVFDPFDVLILHLNKRVSNTFFPFADNWNIWLVFNDGFCRVCFDLLELFELVLVLLVNVMQVFRGHNTLEALVFLLCLRVECSWRVMSSTVDSQRAFRVNFFGLEKEGIVNDCLADVSFHVSGSFLFLTGIDQCLDHFKCGWVVMACSSISAFWAISLISGNGAHWRL